MDLAHAEAARGLFRDHPDTCFYPPRVVQAWITGENVNKLIASHGVNGDIGLFSIDLDGVDWLICRE